MPKVFVYGTLRAGEANDYRMQNASCLSAQLLLEGYELRANGLWYPYAFFSPQRQIYGDLYEVSQAHLEGTLDTLEDTANNYYKRHFDPRYACFIYIKAQDNREDYPLIESGDWIAYRRSQSLCGE